MKKNKYLKHLQKKYFPKIHCHVCKHKKIALLILLVSLMSLTIGYLLGNSQSKHLAKAKKLDEFAGDVLSTSTDTGTAAKQEENSDRMAVVMKANTQDELKTYITQLQEQVKTETLQNEKTTESDNDAEENETPNQSDIPTATPEQILDDQNNTNQNQSESQDNTEQQSNTETESSGSDETTEPDNNTEENEILDQTEIPTATPGQSPTPLVSPEPTTIMETPTPSSSPTTSPLPSPETSQSQSPKPQNQIGTTSLTPLVFTSMCSPKANEYRVWRVRNTNNVDINFWWKVYKNNQKGEGVVSANTEVFFATKTIPGPNTTQIFVGNKLENTKASNPAECPNKKYILENQHVLLSNTPSSSPTPLVSPEPTPEPINEEPQEPNDKEKNKNYKNGHDVQEEKFGKVKANENALESSKVANIQNDENEDEDKTEDEENKTVEEQQGDKTSKQQSDTKTKQQDQPEHENQKNKNDIKTKETKENKGRVKGASTTNWRQTALMWMINIALFGLW